jgi:predicted RecA/RadA family phage recombinase
MQNYIQPGESVTFPAPGSGVTSGQLVFVGSTFGVAAETAATGVLVDIWTEGVFSLPKVSGDAITPGELVYWNATAGAVTVTATGNTKIGVATIAAAADAGTATVRLSGAF